MNDRSGHFPVSAEQALVLAECNDIAHLTAKARELRDIHYGNVITYSRKVFVPLTQLCRDVCHYCTFAKTPRQLDAPYLSVDETLAIARRGKTAGCKEALITLGEKPELRYAAADAFLKELGFASTIDYVAHVAGRILDETGLLPHINAGNLSAREMAQLKAVSASMGLMLESGAARLCEKGMPHYGSPDKVPAARLDTMRRAGEALIPFTSGILIGIGETRRERIESLLMLRDLHEQFGHLQEVIIQNFRPKPDTRMARSPEPALSELVWTIAVARIVMGPTISIQAPPNLSPGVLGQLLDAGINDWGGVSPVTPDHVNPELPWPHLAELTGATRASGKHLEERLTVYPRYLHSAEPWLAPLVRRATMRLSDAEGFGRADCWHPGATIAPPAAVLAQLSDDLDGMQVSPVFRDIVQRASAGQRLGEAEVVSLLQARGAAFSLVCNAADRLRHQINGDAVSYVINRNINYTNICSYKCQFCAFSKGKTHADLRGKPYDLRDEEIRRRVLEARDRGATEVCMQGGIHPDYDGEKYLRILRLVKDADPAMHIHAFSPLEVWHGASTLNLPVRDYLIRLREAGLGSLPGTAAEILDDNIRRIICPDKLSAAQWLDVIRTAHEVGLKTTATIMFGHVDSYRDWASHLLLLRDLQAETRGITEFVPLPFVAEESPIFRRGHARPGPTFREAILMHAVARLVFHRLIENIQASWVKMGPEGLAACLRAGANDLGGTLMDESITRAAGAKHGQEFGARRMHEVIEGAGRYPRQRTTLYEAARSGAAICL